MTRVAAPVHTTLALMVAVVGAVSSAAGYPVSMMVAPADEPGACLARSFDVRPGTVVVGCEFIVNDPTTVFPEVDIRLADDNGGLNGTVLRRVTNMRANRGNIVRASFEPISFSEAARLFAVVHFRRGESRATSRGHGDGIGANSIASGSSSFVSNSGAFLPLGVELGIELLQAGAGKAKLGEATPTDPAAPSLHTENSLGVVHFVLGLDRASFVELAVYDVAGRLVRQLFSGRLPAGQYDVKWDELGASSSPVAAGVYFVKLNADGVRQSQKLVVSR